MAAITNKAPSSITASIKLHDEKPFYTSADTFSGTVTLKVRKEVDVSKVTLKLKADVYTNVEYNHKDRASFFASAPESHRPDIALDTAMITDVPDFSLDALPVQHVPHPYNQLDSSANKLALRAAHREERENRKKDKTAHDDERLYHKELILFPRKEIRETTSGKGFTLPAGEHVYEFSMQIPHAQSGTLVAYPASLQGPLDTFKIVHCLKVTVSRTSSFKMNFRTDQPFKYVPLLDLSAFKMRGPVKMVGEATTANAFMKAAAHLPSSMIETALPGSAWYLPISLKFKATRPVDILLVSIWLEACTSRTAADMNGGKHHDKTVEKIPLIQLRVNQAFSSVDFSQVLQSKPINKFIEPSIATKLLDRVYFIRAKITCMGTQYQAAVNMRERVEIIPPRQPQPQQPQLVMPAGMEATPSEAAAAAVSRPRALSNVSSLSSHSDFEPGKIIPGGLSPAPSLRAPSFESRRSSYHSSHNSMSGDYEVGKIVSRDSSRLAEPGHSRQPSRDHARQREQTALEREYERDKFSFETDGETTRARTDEETPPPYVP